MPSRAKSRSTSTQGLIIFKWIGGLLLVLLLIVFLAGAMLDKPLRRYLEGRMNASLQGYQVEIAEMDFNPIGLSLVLFDLTVRQGTHPQPPILQVPKLYINVHWKKLLTGHLVAKWRVDQPTLHVNLQQLQTENDDETLVKDRGWQDTLKRLYPLEINLLQIDQATLTYVDRDPEHPLELANVNLVVRNIRNIDTPDKTSPSQFRLEAEIFEQGHGMVEGSADFLAEPHMGIKADFELQNILLAKLQPVTSRGNVHISEGTLAGKGQVGFSPSVQNANLANLVIEGLRLDYVHSAVTAKEEQARVGQAKQILKKADQQWQYVVDEVRVLDSDFGYVDRAQEPSFRITLNAFDLTMQNLSNRFHHGAATMELQGQFMHTGDTFAKGEFRPEDEGPDFDLLIAIENTQLREMNDLLRAYAGIDVVEGKFSLYSEILVKGQRIDGYAKPLFMNLDVYDAEQDENASLISKLKEGIIGALGQLLKNQQERVATQFDLSGTVENPEAGSLEIILQLVRNAFFDAILPGFQDQ